MRDDIAAGEVWPEDSEPAPRPELDLVRYVICLEDLVRWLARTYGYEDPETGARVYNDPVFPDEDLYGRELVAAKDLRATWHRVIHGTEEEAPRVVSPRGASSSGS